MRETLIYISSSEIVQYMVTHPVAWGDQDAAGIGGIGDVMPPTPVMGEFLSLMKSKQAPFSQEEFRDHCLAVPDWQSWWAELTPRQHAGFIYGKLYRNFYPAGIDQFYAWALLVEAGWFDTCIMDSLTDAVSKHDIMVSKEGLSPVALDIYIATPAAIRARSYKQKHRQTSSGLTVPTYEIQIPLGRSRNPGNKRWPCLKDFEKVYIDYCKSNDLWNAAIVPCTCGHCGKGRNVRVDIPISVERVPKSYNPRVPSLTVEQVKGAWENVAKRARQKCPGVLAAMLRLCKVLAVEDDIEQPEQPIIVVLPMKQSHFSYIESNWESLKWALNIEFGHDCSVRLMSPGEGFA